jgi:RNA polymerase sigma factor (sigma-70 family)
VKLESPRFNSAETNARVKDETTEQVPRNHSSAVFDTTHWSVVLQAGDETSTEAQAAIENLCRSYWYPLYAYVRRQGHAVEDAQDLTQEFFARLLERKYLKLADRTRGRFRSFLLTSLKHFLINDWKQANRRKRGGGCQFISRDGAELESRFLAEPADTRSADKAFERQWALVLLGRVLDQLQAEFVTNGRSMMFEVLKPFLTGEEVEFSYAEAGGRLNMTEGNVKVTVHRLRQRYREFLKKEISKTVNDPASVDEEIGHLIAILSD